MELDLYLTESKPILKDGHEYLAVVFEGFVTRGEFIKLTEKEDLWKVRIKVD